MARRPGGESGGPTHPHEAILASDHQRRTDPQIWAVGHGPKESQEDHKMGDAEYIQSLLEMPRPKCLTILKERVRTRAAANNTSADSVLNVLAAAKRISADDIRAARASGHEEFLKTKKTPETKKTKKMGAEEEKEVASKERKKKTKKHAAEQKPKTPSDKASRIWEKIKAARGPLNMIPPPDFSEPARDAILAVHEPAPVTEVKTETKQADAPEPPKPAEKIVPVLTGDQRRSSNRALARTVYPGANISDVDLDLKPIVAPEVPPPAPTPAAEPKQPATPPKKVGWLRSLFTKKVDAKKPAEAAKPAAEAAPATVAPTASEPAWAAELPPQSAAPQRPTPKTVASRRITRTDWQTAPLEPVPEAVVEDPNDGIEPVTAQDLEPQTPSAPTAPSAEATTESGSFELGSGEIMQADSGEYETKPTTPEPDIGQDFYRVVTEALDDEPDPLLSSTPIESGVITRPPNPTESTPNDVDDSFEVTVAEDFGDDIPSDEIIAPRSTLRSIRTVAPPPEAPVRAPDDDSAKWARKLLDDMRSGRTRTPEEPPVEATSSRPPPPPKPRRARAAETAAAETAPETPAAAPEAKATPEAALSPEQINGLNKILSRFKLMTWSERTFGKEAFKEFVRTEPLGLAVAGQGKDRMLLCIPRATDEVDTLAAQYCLAQLGDAKKFRNLVDMLPDFGT